MIFNKLKKQKIKGGNPFMYSGFLFAGTCGEYSCRESFLLEDFNSRSKFFYVQIPKHLAGDEYTIKNLFKVINQVEKKLKLSVSDQSKLFLTEFSKTVRIEAGKWWKSSILRRHIFTALIKDAALLKLTSINENLSGTTYFKTPELQKAFKKFLDGYTYTSLKFKSDYNYDNCDNYAALYISESYGWVEIFNDTASLRFLIKKQNKNKKTS